MIDPYQWALHFFGSIIIGVLILVFVISPIMNWIGGHGFRIIIS